MNDNSVSYASIMVRCTDVDACRFLVHVGGGAGVNSATLSRWDWGVLSSFRPFKSMILPTGKPRTTLLVSASLGGISELASTCSLHGKLPKSHTLHLDNE